MPSQHFTLIARAPTGTAAPSGETEIRTARINVGDAEDVRYYDALVADVGNFTGYDLGFSYRATGQSLPPNPLSSITARKTYRDTNAHFSAVYPFTSEVQALLPDSAVRGFSEVGVSSSDGGQFVFTDPVENTDYWLLGFSVDVVLGDEAQTVLWDIAGQNTVRIESADTLVVNLTLDGSGSIGAGTGNLSAIGNVATDDRLHVLIGQRGNVIEVYAKKNDGAWTEIYSTTADYGVAWAQGDMAWFEGFNDTSPMLSTIYRAFLQAGPGLPLPSDATLQSDFVVSDEVRSPTAWHLKYGQPQVDFSYYADEYNSGRHLGSSAVTSSKGTFQATPAPNNPSTNAYPFDFNAGGASGTGPAAMFLNQAKQADGGWFFGGNPSFPNGKRVEEFPSNVDANGYPTSFPTGYDTVFLKYAWALRPAEDFGAWQATWDETGASLNGATPDVSGIVSGESLSGNQYSFTLTSTGGDDNWFFVFRDFIPDAQIFETLQIYPTAHSEVSDWKTRLDAGEHWNPRFYDVAKQCGCYSIRVMDLQATYLNLYPTLASYPTQIKSTWTDGTPLDVICDLVTRSGAKVSQWQIIDNWTDADCTTFGSTIRPLLPGDHKVRAGFGNETWNTIGLFRGPILNIYRALLVEWGDQLGPITGSVGDTTINVTDASLFTTPEIITFGTDSAVYKVTATDEVNDTITIDRLVIDSGNTADIAGYPGLGAAHSGSTVYALPGFSGNNTEPADSWFTKRATETTTAFRTGWASNGGVADRCFPVLEAQSGNINVATRRLAAATWLAKEPSGWVDPKTHFRELQIAPYIGGGMDNQADVKAIINDGSLTDQQKYDAIRDYMMDTDTTSSPRSIYRILGEIDAHKALLTPVVSGQIMQLGFYEGGLGMMQGGTSTTAEVAFYTAFILTSQMVEVLALYEQELIARSAPQFMNFAFVSTPTVNGSYTPFYTVAELDNASNATVQWMLGRPAADIAVYSPARLALDAIA